MSPHSIKYYSLFFSFAVSCSCFGQFTSFKKEQSFLQHLAREQLYRERISLLTLLRDASSQALIDLETAWTYQALHNDSASRQYYERVVFDSIVHYNFYPDYLGLLFKQKELAKINQLLIHPILNKKESDEFRNKLSISLNLYTLNYTHADIQSLALSDQLKSVYKKTLTLQQKSPALAGLYSSLVPGLGKAYYGKKKEAWTAFAATALFGIQAFESYRNAGTNSFRFIFFGTGFSLFYLSNIYGSVRGLHKAKHDWRKQLHDEIYTHHFTADRPVHPLYR